MTELCKFAFNWALSLCSLLLMKLLGVKEHSCNVPAP